MDLKDWLTGLALLTFSLTVAQAGEAGISHSFGVSVGKNGIGYAAGAKVDRKGNFTGSTQTQFQIGNVRAAQQVGIAAPVSVLKAVVVR